MDIPHAQVIKEAIITRKIDNNEKSSVDKINIYKKKLEDASEQYYQNIMQAVKNSIDYMQNKGNNDYIRLNNDDIQAVIICTTTPTHYDITMKCLNAKKHVLCEKPLGKDETEITNCFTLANSLNLKLFFKLIYQIETKLIKK